MSQKKDRSKLVFGFVIAVLCVFFVGGVVIGANSLLEMEGTLEPNDKYLADGLIAVPQNEQELIQVISAAVETAVEGKPKLECSDSIGISDDFLIGEDKSSSINTAAAFIKDGAADEFAASFPELNADFGEGFADKLWIPQLTADDIESFECNYIYYHCTQCNADKNESFDECSECGNKNAPQMRYRDEYEITVNLRQDTAALENNFRLRDAAQIESFVASNFSDYLTVCSPIAVDYKDIQIFVKINRFNGKLLELKFIKNADLTAQVNFKGDYSSAATQDVYLPVREEVRFGLTWPALTLSASELSMTTKGTEALKATLTCDNPLLYDVTWSSSDEKIATVDADGYVNSNKEFGKVVITASFEFQGETYSDECEVFVKNSVESIGISKRSLELKPGETYTQKVSFSPKNATVQTVRWYSTDTAVATVDENGVITAVGVGSADIYAVSDDGYFKATCKTEVTE